MIIGFLVGMFRMLVDTPITLGLFPNYREGSFLWIVNNINFQYFSIPITIISAIVMAGVSYLTEAPDAKQISGPTFATATAAGKAKTRASWGKLEVICSIIVLVCVTFACLYFRG
jgi:SSS family solute:Na+ symporter